jgi:hypothetical protein
VVLDFMYLTITFHFLFLLCHGSSSYVVILDFVKLDSLPNKLLLLDIGNV